jgi:predicted ATPase
MSRRELWRTLHERFDPELPAPPQWRAPRPNGLAKQILETLERPFGTSRLLLMGTTGTGKTTELLRVAEARDETDLVVFMDLAQHFTEVVRDPRALERIAAWEVCFLTGLALVHRVRERLGVELDRHRVAHLAEAWEFLARATGWPRETLDSVMFTQGASNLGIPPTNLDEQGTVVGVKNINNDASGLRSWSIPIGRSREALPDQDGDVQQLLSTVNLLLGEVQSKHRKVLLVIDGLDRIRDLSRAKALFVESQLLSRLQCALVISGPSALRHHHAAAGLQGFRPMRIVNEPVLDHDHPERLGSGVEFFRTLYALRTNDLGAEAKDLVSEEHLTTLAYRSGGRARDFVRFIRTLAEAAWDQDASTTTPGLVKQVLDEWRWRQETGLNRAHIQLLEKVMRDPEHRLPQDPLADELLEYNHLLSYSNDSEWYYPHPLLTLHLLTGLMPVFGPTATKPLARMLDAYVSRIVIEGVRSLRGVQWDIAPAPGWHVLIGDNGAGKSSALRAIAATLLGNGRRHEGDPTALESSSDSALALRIDFNSWRRQAQVNGNVVIELRVTETDGKQTHQEHHLQVGAQGPAWSGATHGHELFSAGFGPFRRFSGGDADYEKQFTSLPRVTRYLSLFDERVSMTEALRWLKDLQFRALVNTFSSDFLDRVKGFINQEGFLPNGVRLRDITPDAVRFMDANGSAIAIEELSDGYRSILSLTLELLRQLTAHYGPDLVFDSTAKTVTANGVVLLDEADVHLHPTWQREIGLRLKKLFPRLQFIVTTHSPLVCQSADTVYLLPRPGTEEQGRMLEEVELKRLKYGSVLDAYGTGVFGRITRSEEGKQLLEKLAELNRKEIEQGLTEKEEQKQEELRAIFPTENPVRETSR